MLARGHQHGVLHRVPDDLRIDPFLLAQDFDGLINVAQAASLMSVLRLVPDDYHSNLRLAFSTSSSGNWTLFPGEGSSVMIPSAKLRSARPRSSGFLPAGAGQPLLCGPQTAQTLAAAASLRSTPGELTSRRVASAGNNDPRRPGSVPTCCEMNSQSACVTPSGLSMKMRSTRFPPPPRKLDIDALRRRRVGGHTFGDFLHFFYDGVRPPCFVPQRPKSNKKVGFRPLHGFAKS